MPTITKNSSGSYTSMVTNTRLIVFTVDSLNTFEDQINYILKNDYSAICLHVIMSLKYALNEMHSQATDILHNSDCHLTGLKILTIPNTNDSEHYTTSFYTSLTSNKCGDNSIVFKSNNEASAKIDSCHDTFNNLSVDKIDKSMGAEAYIGLCDVNNLNTPLKDVKNSITFVYKLKYVC